jgi:hypothetical protein
MCASRLRLLRALNPGLPIYGIYGGSQERRPEFACVETLLDAAWACHHGDGPWRWRNIDKMMWLWYQEVGHSLSWSVLFEYQADLLVARPIRTYTDLCPNPKDVLFYRNPLSFAELAEHGWPWLAHGLDELRGFMNHLTQHYGCDRAFCVQNIVFTIAPRQFFDDFREGFFDIPGVVEYRSPSLARAQGYNLVEYVAPAADLECMSFATGHQSRERVLQELATENGARMFHRVLEELEPECVLPLLHEHSRP